MKAKIDFIENEDELKKAEDMGMDSPELKTKLYDLHFRIDQISTAYHIEADKQIALDMKNGRHYLIDYDKEIWNKIKLYLAGINLV